MYNKHMRIVVLYRPESENSRRVEDYVSDFERFHPGDKLDVMNVDSPEGIELMRIYGIIEQPTVLAMSNDGVAQQIWQGVDKMPTMNDLIYYSQQ